MRGRRTAGTWGDGRIRNMLVEPVYRGEPEDFIHDLEVPTILDTLAPDGAIVTVLNTIEGEGGKVDVI